MTSLQYLPQSLQKRSVNWKAILFWGIIIGWTIATIFYFQKPVIGLINSVPSQISNFQLPDLNNLTLDNILAFLTKYGSLFAMAGLGITFIYGLYQKHQANQATLKSLEMQNQANVQLNNAYSSATTYQQQAETYKAKYEALTNSGNQDVLLESQKLVSLKEDQIKNLQGQIQALSGKANMGESEMATYLRMKGYAVEKKVTVP